MFSQSETTQLVCAAALAVLFSIQAVHGYHETVDKCSKELGITPEELESFDVQSIMEGKEPPHNIKCLFHCSLKEHDLISADGIFSRELILSALTPEYADWLKGCLDKPSPSPDPCERAWAFNSCLLDSNPEFFAALAELEND